MTDDEVEEHIRDELGRAMLYRALARASTDDFTEALGCLYLLHEEQWIGTREFLILEIANRVAGKISLLREEDETQRAIAAKSARAIMERASGVLDESLMLTYDELRWVAKNAYVLERKKYWEGLHLSPLSLAASVSLMLGYIGPQIFEGKGVKVADPVFMLIAAIIVACLVWYAKRIAARTGAAREHTLWSRAFALGNAAHFRR